MNSEFDELQSNKSLYKDVFETIQISKEIDELRQIIFSINKEQESSVYTKT